MSRAMALLLLLPWTVGCGSAAVLWVEVGAPLLCPEQCDTLQIEVALPDGTPVLTEQHDLRFRTPSFPQSASFSTTQERYLGAPGLRVRASVLKGEALAAPWAEGTANVVLRDDSITKHLFLFEAPL